MGEGYLLMRKAGELRTFEGAITPIAPFLKWVAAELGGARPKCVVSDRYRPTDGAQAQLDVTAIADWPWEFTPVGAGPQGGENVLAFQKAVISRKVRVRKSLLWAQAISQSFVREVNGNQALDKASGLSRIDVLQAGILALGAAFRAGAKGPSRMQRWMAAEIERQKREAKEGG